MSDSESQTNCGSSHGYQAGRSEYALGCLYGKLDTARTVLSEVRDLVGTELTQKEADTVDYLSRQVGYLIGAVLDEQKNRLPESR